jgi:hypothetical protein
MPPTLDDELVSSLDQPIPYDPTKALDQIESFYRSAKEGKGVYLVLNKVKEIIGNFRTSGLILSKLLYMLHRDWDEYEVGDNFEDVVTAEIGISKITISRYLSVWTIFEHVSLTDNLTAQLQAKPMKSLIPIGTAIDQGYDIDEDTWQELAEAPDDATVRRLLRDVKGQEPRKNSLVIALERNGDLTAYRDGKQAFIGWLDVKKDDEIITKAVKRIVDSTGIMVK